MDRLKRGTMLKCLETSSVWALYPAPWPASGRFAFSLVQSGAIKPVRQKTPLEIILRTEELRNLPGLFETGAAAGPYTPRWSQAIGIFAF